MKQSISVTIPFALGTEVYKKEDLRVLENHTVSYAELVLYRVVGYEVSFVDETSWAPTSTAVVESGRAILKYKSVGGTSTDFAKRFYVHPDQLVENTSDLAGHIAAVAGFILPRSATTE